MNATDYLIFFPLSLIMFLIPTALVSFVVLLIAKIYKHENLKSNLLSLLPFSGLLTLFYFIMASFWDLFIEGPGKLFQYWDHLPWDGFYLFSHDHPIATTLKTGGLAPGVSLMALDLIWLFLLIIMYALSTGVFWKLKRNSRNSFRNAIIISIILLVLGCILGLNQGAAQI